MTVSRIFLPASIAILSIVVMITALLPVFNNTKTAVVTDIRNDTDVRNDYGMPVI